VTFNGTGVWIYGAKRDNHGKYNASLDGNPFFDDGYSSVNIFRQVLFPGPGLASGTHTVSVMNSFEDTAKPYLDIDSVSLSLV